MYDPKTFGTVSGEVSDVYTINPAGMRYGIGLLLNSGTESVEVHLGPGWYIENQDLKINPGDKVEISGSRIMFQGKPVIIASEVKKGKRILRLRDKSGAPAWAGWRRMGLPLDCGGFN